MKKINLLFCFIATILLFTIVSPKCFAQQINSDSEVIIYTQKEVKGDYTYITVLTKRVNPDNNLNGTRQMISGSKTTYAIDESGNNAWSITVNATFSYNGSIATCVGAYPTTAVYASGWSVTGSSCSISTNSATAYGSAEKRVMGFVVKTDSRSGSIQCDSNGNIS